ncbi:MAG TPA: SDR family NAD(P)-dependent oxidoreductase [Streptosporangiaceae bacterium]|jgi:short-subunit dehydrogenase
MRLAGAVALITGGSSGIGAATARALAGAGACPLVAGRDPARLNEVARQTGATPLIGDLAEPEGPAELAAAALAEAGRVDLLISNAGVGWAGEIGELTAAKAAELIAVNLLAPIHLARELVPDMAKRGAGHLVFVSSIAGATGARDEAVYAAAKAGLGSFAESLSYELGEHGVGVSVVVPGVVDTPFFDRRGRPYNRKNPAPIPPERVARAILSAAALNRDVVFVPGWMRFPAWLHGTAPRTFRALASRFG